MMTRINLRAFCAVIFFAFGLGDAVSENSSGLTFNDLDGVARHPLDPAEKKASVLFFYCQDCPISNGYAVEINRICATHTNFMFYIVQVDPDLTPALAREHARQYDLHAPVLLDSQHRLVKLARATGTPEVVVIGKKGRVLYRGRIDDLYAALGKKRNAATRHNLIEALDAIEKGRAVKPKETQAIGCVIP